MRKCPAFTKWTLGAKRVCGKETRRRHHSYIQTYTKDKMDVGELMMEIIRIMEAREGEREREEESNH